MGKTTISVENATHSRFISNKGSYEHAQGRSIESDEFLNELLTVYERVQQVAEAALQQAAEMGGMPKDG